MAVSDTTGKAGDVPALIAKVAALQNLKEYAELNWEGTFEDYLDIVRKNPAVTRTRLPARLRHDPVVRRRKSTSTTRSG